MLMSGRCGFSENWATRSGVVMRSGHRPGKCSSKKGGSDVSGEADREAKVAEGANRVHVKERSSDGIAMNMKDVPGQMWRWCWDMANEESAARGGMWNSHQSVSMYSCW